MSRIVAVLLLACCVTAPVMAADQVPPDRAIQIAINRESMLITTIASAFSPMAETYIQRLKRSADGRLLPQADDYYLGRLRGDKQELVEDFYVKSKSKPGEFLGSLFGGMEWNPVAFALQMVIDPYFDRQHLAFQYLGREFLGSVRCYVYDVRPLRGGSFEGRIWVEDEEFNIVRAKGHTAIKGWLTYTFHFDQWREHTAIGYWLPSYIYFEEVDFKYAAVQNLRFRAFTRFWAYAWRPYRGDHTLTDVVVEPSSDVEDRSRSERERLGSVAIRAWSRETEDNVLDRLEASGLLAPAGELDQTLTTIASNIAASNKLDASNLRVRVLLSSPLESFAVGNTVVLSRGLIDVAPDESTLAFVVSRELARVLTGSTVELKYAFNDRLMFADKDILKKLRINRDGKHDGEIEATAVRLFSNSRYATSTSNLTAFLRNIHDDRNALSNLFRPNIGYGWYADAQMSPSSFLPASAQVGSTHESALPLGTRVRVDPLLGKLTAVAPDSNERPIDAAFQVVPLQPYLTRIPPVTVPPPLVSADTDAK